MALEIEIWPLPDRYRPGGDPRPVPSVVPYWDFLVPKIPGGKYLIEEAGTGRTTIDVGVVFGQPVPNDLLRSIGFYSGGDPGFSAGESGPGWTWAFALALLGVGAWLALR